MRQFEHTIQGLIRPVCFRCAALTHAMTRLTDAREKRSGKASTVMVPGWRVCPRCGPVEEHGVLELREVETILENTKGILRFGKAPYGLPKTFPSRVITGSSEISRAMNDAIDSEAGITLTSSSP